jgi:hypothetical protein
VLLQARGDVDDVAADHQLAASSSVAAGDDVARVHADPQPDVSAVALAYAVSERAEPVANGERRPDGTLRIVLVRLRGAENSEHGVPGELLGAAPEPLDLGVDQLEELTKERAKVLGVEQLADRSRAREVGEENGDDAAFLPLVGLLLRSASILV